MPAIRPTLEYKYQHRQFPHKLVPPFTRKSVPNFGPKFKPTRSAYVEADNRNVIKKILLQRRRVDGKVILSDVRRIEKGLDTSGLNTDEEMKDKLILLFDHENLVRIMDIQLDTAAGQVRMACPGFEHMSRGTLNRILWDKVAIPESLCWHVLEGLTNALLWLHHGYKNSNQEGDWNPIALINIHPGAIYFTAPQDDETYGVAKVSNFDNAIVMRKGQKAHDAVRIHSRARHDLGNYVAPELLYFQASAALVSDIYSLGATLYHMMLGQPPEAVNLSHETTTDPPDRDFWVQALPEDTYSCQLKRIVREMLRESIRRRPDGVMLYQNLMHDMEVWRGESEEGRRYVRRGECPRGFPVVEGDDEDGREEGVGGKEGKGRDGQGSEVGEEEGGGRGGQEGPVEDEGEWRDTEEGPMEEEEEEGEWGEGQEGSAEEDEEDNKGRGRGKGKGKAKEGKEDEDDDEGRKRVKEKETRRRSYFRR